MDGGAWWATVHGVTKSLIRLNKHMHTRACMHTHIHTDSQGVTSRWRSEALPSVILHINRCAERCFHDGVGVMTGG